jgi:hypothetical protein
MKDFGAWFNELQPPPGVQQAEQTRAAQGAASWVVNDPYLSVDALMGGCLAPGQLISCVAQQQQYDLFFQPQTPRPRERAHVVLHGDALSPQVFNEECTFDDVSRWLQRAVAQRWEVYPMDMVSASQPMKVPSGCPVEVHAQTFGLLTALDNAKQATSWAALQLAQRLWGDLQNAWPVGMLVLWRTRPQVLYDKLTGHLGIRLRLAGWQPPQSGCRVHVAEGERFPTIKDLA